MASTPATRASSDALAADTSLPPSDPSKSAADPADDFAQRVATAQAGSAAALGELLEGCRNYLLLIANRELGDNLQAKLGASDVVQDTFVQAHQLFHRFQGTENEHLLAWLAQILEHKLAHAHRQFARTQKRNVRREVQFDAPVEGVNRDVAHRDATPSGIASGKEEHRRVELALARLPDDMRRAVELRCFERQSFAEVGEKLNRSAEAARKLWVRAVCRLQNLLEEVSREIPT